MEEVGIPAPDTGLSSVPGGLYDREGASDDRGGSVVGNAVDKAEKAIDNTVDKIAEKADIVAKEVQLWME